MGSGILANVFADDTDYLVLNDAETTPGLNIDFTFGGEDPVTTTNLSLHLIAKYTGITADEVIIQQWNYTSSGWVAVTGETDDLPHNTALQTYTFALTNAADYLSGGQIKVRFSHADLGIAGHALTIDFMYLTTP